MIVKNYGKLRVEVHPSRDEMGKAAANEAAKVLKKLLNEKEIVNVAFAAAPSQAEFLQHLMSDDSIAWNRIRSFHLDDYVGLEVGAPESFHNFLKENVFSKQDFKKVYYIDEVAQDGDPIELYTELLKKYPLDAVFIGIGENGHIAFNDPPVANFKDPAVIKIVELDEVCRQQQVNDECFSSIDEVPRKAYTLTIPTVVGANYIFCIVPGERKAPAIKCTLEGPISTACPASVLRHCDGATLYLDEDAAAELKK